MAVVSNQVNVGTTPTPLTGTGASAARTLCDVTIDADGAISIGGSAVTVAGGIRIAAGGVQKFTLRASETLYAIGGSATTCRVLVASRYL